MRGEEGDVPEDDPEDRDVDGREKLGMIDGLGRESMEDELHGDNNLVLRFLEPIYSTHRWSTYAQQYMSVMAGTGASKRSIVRLYERG